MEEKAQKEMKKRRYIEKHVIYAVKEMAVGLKAKEGAREFWDERGHAVCLEVTVRRAGSDFAFAVARSGTGVRAMRKSGRAIAFEERGPSGGDPDNRMELADQRRGVSFVMAGHGLREA